MLRWRLLLGPLLVAAFLGLCWLDAGAQRPGMWLFPIALAVSILGSQELLWLFAARNLKPAGWLVYAGNFLIVLANWGAACWPDGPLGTLGWPLAAFVLLVLAAFCEEMRRYTGPGQVMERLALAVLALAYVGLLLSFVCQLRLIGIGTGGGQRMGIAALLSLIIVVKLGDTGAYTFGRLFGRHKLAPVLSPGKTIEGAIGAIVLGCVGAWLSFHWVLPLVVGSEAVPSGSLPAATPPWGWMVFGLLVATAGLVGDLAESLIKRDVGRKDSGRWLPGYGGGLDLLDSILFAAPVAWLCWACGLVGR